jgi:hypothetical protein
MPEPYNVINMPRHSHPHSVFDTTPDKYRIWVCTECKHVFLDSEIRKDKADEWGHPCMYLCKHSTRCESHLEPFLPETLLHGSGLR